MNTTLGGRYRLGEVLGVGGMGTVYAATDERLDRPVAVKVLREDLARDDDARARFEREARAAAKLAHPNVVTVFDTGHGPPESFLVMERCSGETLLDQMRRGPLSDGQLQRVAQDVAAALGAAHHAGIVHRDVKPANVLVAYDGRCKVADFGIAKALDTGDHPTVGPGFGTPAYTAPERLRGEPATPASDVWSLGVLLYEAATGERPLTGAHRPLRELRPDVDPAVAALVERSLSPEPGARPRDGAAALVLLGAHDDSGGEPTRALGETRALTETAVLPGPVAAARAPARAAQPRHPRHPRHPRRPRRPRHRGIAALVATGAVVVAATVAGALLVGSGGDPSSTPTTGAPTTTATPAAIPTTTVVRPTGATSTTAVAAVGPPTAKPGKGNGKGNGKGG